MKSSMNNHIDLDSTEEFNNVCGLLYLLELLKISSAEKVFSELISDYMCSYCDLHIHVCSCSGHNSRYDMYNDESDYE